MSKVTEADLLKAIDDMSASLSKGIEKEEDKNGGLASKAGGELLKGEKKGKKKSLLDWAKEEMGEEAHKGLPSPSEVMAAMKAKKKPAVSEEYEEDDEDDEDDEEGEEMEKCKKSTFSDDLRKSETSDVIDAIPFLGDLVNSLEMSDSRLVKSFEQFQAKTESQNDLLTKALVGISRVLVEMKGELDRIGGMKTAPKSMISKSQVSERFAGDINANIDKRDMLGQLSDLVKSGQAVPLDLIQFETDGTVRPEVARLFKKA